MTISTTASATTLGGNGVTTAFNFGFIAGTASNLLIIFNDGSGNQTTLTPSQYTLVLNAAASNQIWGVGGTVTYPTSGSPIPSGSTLTIQRIVPLTQLTAISNQGDFYPQVVEKALDTLCLEIQQISARTGQFRGIWATNNSYNYGDIVVDGVNGSNTTNWYLCISANTSGIWATDLANGDWTLILNLQGIANPGTVAAGGDLTGNYPNPTIAKIQGTTVAGITGTGNIVFSASPTFTGTIIAAAATFSGVLAAVTAAAGTNTTQVATTAFVNGGLFSIGTQFNASGTWTPAAGTTRAIIYCIGGGAGGAATGGSGATNGGTGGTTSVGSLCSAVGGSGGTAANGSTRSVPGAGGLASGGTGTVKFNGNGGQLGHSLETAPISGGDGGGSFFGGAPVGATGAAGGSAAANSGSGGAGGGQANGGAISAAGAGGGSGALSIYIGTVSGAQTITIGAAGTAGVAGTSGTNGGAGGSGYVLIFEYK